MGSREGRRDKWREGGIDGSEGRKEMEGRNGRIGGRRER